MASNFPFPSDPPPAAAPSGFDEAPTQIFLPVDASTVSQRALQVAIRLAQRQPAQLVLFAVPSQHTPAGVTPAAPALVSAPADEYRPAYHTPSIDQEGAAAEVLWSVLLPLQRKAEAAGLVASLRLLHSPDPALELREILAITPGDRVLILPNPLSLSAPLGPLVADLLAAPPCGIYLLGPSQRPRGAWWEIVAQLLKATWSRTARQHIRIAIA